MQAFLALAVALSLSLVGNAWQWQNRSASSATASGEVLRVIDANESCTAAIARAETAMWELAGDSAQLEVANKRGEEQHAALEKQLLAERKQRAKELDDAYQHDDVRAWGAQPVPARLSRMYGQERGSAPVSPRGARDPR
jgi:hypothetical protein